MNKEQLENRIKELGILIEKSSNSVKHFDWSRQQEDLANHIMERLGEMFGTVKEE